MNYQAKTKEIYNIRNQIAETIGEIEKPQPVGRMDGRYYFKRKEFELFNLKVSLSYTPYNNLMITLP